MARRSNSEVMKADRFVAGLRSRPSGDAGRFGLPEQLEAELNLPGSCRGTGHRSAGRRDNAGSGGGGAGRKGDQIWRVEIGTIQQVEKFGAKLQIEPFGEPRVLESRKVPSCEAGTNQRVSAQIAIKTAAAWRTNKRFRIEPLAWIPQNYGARECGIHKRTDRISRVSIIGGVVAELGSKWEA